MQLWQIALAALVVAWMAQAAGTFIQMRHYRDVMRDVSDKWSDGFVGAGNARARFGRGVILLLVVSSDGLVRRLAVMEGRSVFAKFKIMHEFDGVPLTTVEHAPVFAARKGRALALSRAVEQIGKARSKPQDGVASIAGATA